MAIKTVAVAQAPDRFFKRGIITVKQDYVDVMRALTQMKQGEALIVTMTQADWVGVEKPETKFGYTLRRYFESKAVDITAYQSGPFEVTIRKATALDKARARGPKSKK